MIHAKLGRLGLCTVVFGLMAFSASAAQAEVGAQWLFAEKAPGTSLIKFLEAELGLEPDTSTLVLHTEILKIKTLFACTNINAVGAKLKANGSIGEGAKLLFSGCKTELNGTESSECTLTNAADGKGAFITNASHGLIVLHELAGGAKDDLLKLLPDSGEVFGTLEFPGECPLGSKIPLIGKLTLKDCENLFLTHLTKHLFEVGPLTELFVISKTAEHSMILLGSAWARLIGAHEGLKFSGDPA